MEPACRAHAEHLTFRCTNCNWFKLMTFRLVSICQPTQTLAPHELCRKERKKQMYVCMPSVCYFKFLHTRSELPVFHWLTFKYLSHRKITQSRSSHYQRFKMTRRLEGNTEKYTGKGCMRDRQRCRQMCGIEGVYPCDFVSAF